MQYDKRKAKRIITARFLHYFGPPGSNVAKNLISKKVFTNFSYVKLLEAENIYFAPRAKYSIDSYGSHLSVAIRCILYSLYASLTSLALHLVT